MTAIAGPATASLTEERHIAILRLPLALPPLLVFLQALGPVAQPELMAIAAALNAAYAVLAAVAADRAAASPWAPFARSWAAQAPLTLGIDLAMATALLHAIGRPSTVPALIYLHILFAATVRWGPTGGGAIALLGGFFAGAALLATAPLTQIGLTGLLLMGTALLGSRFCGIARTRREQAVAAERDRLARNLHDDVVQALVAAGLRVELCRSMVGAVPRSHSDDFAAELDALQRLIEDALKDARGHLSRMRRARRPDETLQACMERCAQEVFRGAEVETRVVVPAELELAPEVETAAFYIVREAFFNARKHAAARHVVVRLECRHDVVTVTIADDGRGVDAERPGECDGAPPPGDGHRGLRTMRERAEALGGTVQLISAPRDGVCVRAELPLAPRP